MRIKFVNLPNLTMFVALALSAIAAYYSIIGLTAIFAGAMIPVIVMGGMLEVAKITTTVWLRKYWDKCGWLMKSYLVPAVIALALLTSMGIFGFLSKAHIDQGVPTGDVAAKVSLIEEKIKTQRDNIKSAREALVQMDAQVNNVMNKGDSEKSAERSVLIRRQQASERGKLQKEIEVANLAIGKLNEEKAPIASQLRKVEAEVGPIKYIAAMIYGDNPDQNILEKAVRWMIILLVLVFDPLAVALILAANQSTEWDKAINDDVAAMSIVPPKDEDTRPFTKEEIQALDGAVIPMYEPDDGPLTENQVEQIKETLTPSFVQGNYNVAEPVIKNWDTEVTPIVNTTPDPIIETKEITEFEGVRDSVTDEWVQTGPEYKVQIPVAIQTEGVTTEPEFKTLEGGYVTYQGKHMNANVLRDMRPDLFRIVADSGRSISTNFGTSFPKISSRGDVFVRVDVLPNQVYKFDGYKWMLVNKDHTDSYLHNQDYITYLVEKIEKGEYDVELLSEHEKQMIEEYLNDRKS